MRLHIPVFALAVAACAPVLAGYAELPLSFEPNQGQSRPDVLYLARHGKLALGLTATGLIAPRGLRIEFANARAGVRAAGLDRQPGVTHYLVGRDPREWHTHIPNYARVRYSGLWPGVDAVFYGNARQLEFDFVVAPGADPGAIELAFNRDVRLDAGGNLIAGDGYVQRRPMVYQDSGGKRREIRAAYVLRGPRRAGFELGTYDPALPLVIDPLLTYSTFFGGSGADSAAGVAIDNARNLYIAGTSQGGLPTTAGSYQPNLAGTSSDVFVAKLNPAGTALVFATYLGGSGDDTASALARDSAGGLYIAGYTRSSDFPGAFAPIAAPFVAKLSAAGDSLVWATQIRDASAVIAGMAVDSQSRLALAGSRGSDTATPTAFIQRRGPVGEAGWEYTLPTGGSRANAVALDPAGNIYVVGVVQLAVFGTLQGAAQYNYGGGASDGFLMKLGPGGTLLYRTYLGGGGGDSAAAVEADSDGFAYVAGATSSATFRTTEGAFQRGHAGMNDAFLAKVSVDGSSLVYSTLLGGSGNDSASAVKIDATRMAHVAGQTSSGNFPVAGSPMQSSHGGFADGFVVKLLPSAESLVYSTYLGGCGDESIAGVALDSTGAAYVAGSTTAANFPVADALQARNAGNSDAFVAKISSAVGTSAVSPCALNAASLQPGPLAPGELIAVFNPGGGPSTDTFAVASGGTIYPSLASTRVLFDGIAAPLLYARNTQINAIVPYVMRDHSSARLDVEYRNAIVASTTVDIAPAAPAIFAMAPSAGSTRPRAVVMNQDGTLNSWSNPAPTGSYVTIWATGLGDTTPHSLDGHMGAVPLPQQLYPVSVNAGSAFAEVTYAGAAPSLVAGTAQVNFRIADCAGPGADQPLILGVHLPEGRDVFAQETAIAISRGAGVVCP
jgi:uncharacterized protein (TIGR03437 family)